MTVLYVDELLQRIELQIYYTWNVAQHFRAPLESLPAISQSLHDIAYADFPSLQVSATQAAAALSRISEAPAQNLLPTLTAMASSLQGINGTWFPFLEADASRASVALSQLAFAESPSLRGLLTSLSQAVKGLPADLSPLLAQVIQALGQAVPLEPKVQDAIFKWLGDQTASGPGGWFMEIVATVASELGKLIVGGVQGAVDILHVPIEKAILPTVQKTFENYRAAVTTGGEVNPEDYTALAVQGFNAALRLGALAHGFGSIVELLHPTKQIGLAHLAAGLSDAAGFEPVMRAAIGKRLDLSLGRAAEMSARRDFRSVWAAPREFIEMWLEGRISAEQVRERLRVEGWPEWQITAYMGSGENDKGAVPYREARPIDLAYIYEDITAPDAWIRDQLRQSGFHPEDAEVLMTGLRRRSMRTHTSGFISELVGTFQDGLLSESGLRAHLQGLGLREEAQDLIVNRAAMGYFRRTALDLLAVYRELTDKGVISITDFRSAIAGFGFQEHTIAAEVARVDARARGRVLVEERREAEGAIREFQRLLGTEYAERVRRGLVTPEAMEDALALAGVEPAQAAAMARIAAVRQIPSLKLPEALTPQAEAVKVREILARAALERVRDALMSGEVAVAYLVSIGVPKPEAEAEVALALTQGFRPPKVQPPPKEAPEVREARRNRTQAAVAAFQAGEFEEAGLLKRLQDLGHPVGVAVSLVEQEATERRLRLQREAEREREKVLAEVQKLEQTLILELVRKRLIEPDEASGALVSIGVPGQEAALLVQRELVKAAPAVR